MQSAEKTLLCYWIQELETMTSKNFAKMEYAKVYSWEDL
jgi:hypothetical protein